MTAATLRSDERIGLLAALAAHAGLVAWLVLWRPAPAPLPEVDRVSVTLSEEVGLEATTPQPSADPAPDSGPQPGDSAPPPAAVVAPEPAPPAPVPPRPEPRPLPQPIARVTPPPRPVARPVTPPPRPVARPTQPPRRDAIADLLAQRTPTARPTVRPTARPTGRPVARPTGAPGGRPNANPTARPGAPGFADAFRTGIPGASGAGQPPAKPGPAQVTSIRGSINAKVRGPWNACSVTGLDVSKLRASVTFSLDKQGRVTSVNPPLITGVSDANRAQAGRFGECAVKAIRTAAPYANLPPEFYDHWKLYKLNFRKE